MLSVLKSFVKSDYRNELCMHGLRILDQESTCNAERDRFFSSKSARGVKNRIVNRLVRLHCLRFIQRSPPAGRSTRSRDQLMRRY